MDSHPPSLTPIDETRTSRAPSDTSDNDLEAGAPARSANDGGGTPEVVSGTIDFPVREPRLSFASRRFLTANGVSPAQTPPDLRRSALVESQKRKRPPASQTLPNHSSAHAVRVRRARSSIELGDMKTASGPSDFSARLKRPGFARTFRDRVKGMIAIGETRRRQPHVQRRFTWRFTVGEFEEESWALKSYDVRGHSARKRMRELLNIGPDTGSLRPPPGLLSQQSALPGLFSSDLSEPDVYCTSSSESDSDNAHPVVDFSMDPNKSSHRSKIPLVGRFRTSFVDLVMDRGTEKLGTFDGVFLRSIFNIFGVIFFLRVPFIVGSVGGGISTAIILCTVLVTFLTTLSLSAILTNGSASSVCSYIVISRTVGPELGGPIGILLAVANMINLALHLLGFAKVIELIAGGQQFGFESRVYSIMVLLFVAAFTTLSIHILGAFQRYVVFPIFLVSLAAFVIGLIVKEAQDDEITSTVFAGFSRDTLKTNIAASGDLATAQRSVELFFPGVFGILCGANFCARLKDPVKSIPFGTLMGVFFTAFLYLALVWLLTASAKIDALRDEFMAERIIGALSVSRIPFYCGVMACALSQAITNFASAVRLIGNVSRDRIYPVLNWLTAKSPRLRLNIFVFVIAVCCILPGSIDELTPYITAFFLLTYAAINFACFLQSYNNAPGWRPKFRYFNKWLSLATFFYCIVVMFFLSLLAAGVAAGSAFVLGFALLFIKPEVNWGDAVRTLKYTTAKNALLALNRIEGTHVKNYLVQLLVLCDDQHNSLRQFATKFLRKGRGAIIFGKVITRSADEILNFRYPDSVFVDKHKWETRRQVNAFSCAVIADSLRSGARSMLQCCGVSRMSPNVLLLGMMKFWQLRSREDCQEYVDIVRDAFVLNKGVCLVFGAEKLNFETEYSGRIDVWWLEDDGGLTLLMPYLMTLSHRWAHAKIRIMNIVGFEDAATVVLAQMVSRFRIEADCFPVRIGKSRQEILKPSEKIREYYENLTKLEREEPKHNIHDTARQLVMADKIFEHSSDADLVVITLPIPEVKLDPVVWLSWLQCLANGMPPTLFVRGNQESVLTWEP
eukprot:272326_1